MANVPDNFPRHYTPPKRRFAWLAGVALTVALACGVLIHPLANAQPRQAAPAQKPEPQINVQVNLVDLFVTVRDKHTKQILSDLNQDDFRITEDGVEQKIAFFSRESKLPVTMGLLLDTSGSEEFTLGAEQDAAIRFFSRVMRKGDLAMVISFDSNADLLADFTDTQAILSRAIRRARINAPANVVGTAPSSIIAGTVLYDAIYVACHDKLAGETGRKALIIITDAQDEGSRLRIQDAIEAAQRTDTVTHILLIGDPRNFRVNEGAARKITDETGGRTIVVRNARNLEQSFEQISEELRSQYTLGYYSTNKARDGSYRKVKVEVTRKNADALSRRGYYAPK